MRYNQVTNRPKGTIETFYEDASVAANRSGLTVSAMTASVLSGNSIGISDANYNSTTEELSYRVSFNSAGKSIVEVSTTFNGTTETIKSVYLYRTIDHEDSIRDYW